MIQTVRSELVTENLWNRSETAHVKTSFVKNIRKKILHFIVRVITRFKHIRYSESEKNKVFINGYKESISDDPNKDWVALPI